MACFKYHTNEAYADKDFSEVMQVGCDEISSKKGHNYITIFADMATKIVIFATSGKTAKTVERFTEELPKHNANAELMCQNLNQRGLILCEK